MGRNPKKALKRKAKPKTFRKRNKGNPKVVYPTSPPRIMRACLKYVDNKLISLTGPAPTNYSVWRPNDTFDPDYSGVGHQSMFRDQFYSLYNWCRCIAYTHVIKIVSDSDIPTEVLFGPQESPTFTTHPAFSEAKWVKKCLVTRNKPYTMKLSFLVDRVLGNRKYTALTDDTFKQANNVSLSQAASCWTCVSVNNPNISGANTVNIYIEHSIKQYVQFSEPTQQTQS